ncbi:MAG: histidine ammonia-lyase [Candidatus Zixiibacteriota bacterium]
MSEPLIIKLDDLGNTNRVSIDDIIEIAENHRKIEISDSIKDIICDQREKLDRQMEKYPEIKIYGTNSLHGDLKDVNVSQKMLKKYQRKYIKVHNCGTGDPLPPKVVRALMAIRLISLVKGFSGMRWETIELLRDMLNHDLIPVVLEEGSVGASGDLVPLAMVAAAMINLPEARVYLNEKWDTGNNADKNCEIISGYTTVSAGYGFKKSGLKPVELEAKEAMGLTNGTNFMASIMIFAIRDLENVLKHASISGALALEAIRGEKDAFSEIICNNRPHRGQVEIAKQIRRLIDGSRRMSPDSQKQLFNIKSNDQHDKPEVRVQDRYSFRAIPQVHGVAYEAIEKAKDVLTVEINSVTDNPLFKEVPVVKMQSVVPNVIYRKLIENNEKTLIKAYSGANFHGQPLASIIDYVKTAVASLGLISDRRSFSLLDKKQSYGLPSNLAYDMAEADGGLMLLQYAGAARAAENKVLASPSSVTSVPTSANQEDFVSMGANGAIHLRKMVHNMQVIIAVEMICALRALQLTDGAKWLPSHLQKLGAGNKKIYDFLSSHNRFAKGDAEDENKYLRDHYLRTDLIGMVELLESGRLLDEVGFVFE